MTKHAVMPFLLTRHFAAHATDDVPARRSLLPRVRDSKYSGRGLIGFRPEVVGDRDIAEQSESQRSGRRKWRAGCSRFSELFRNSRFDLRLVSWTLVVARPSDEMLVPD